MKIRVFKNRKGVTILEGLVAMGILAMVAVGVFGVVVSISRKSNQPDIREEMVYAVEQAYRDLQMYTSTNTDYPVGIGNNLPPCMCPDSADEGNCETRPNPLKVSDEERFINCRLPPICDPDKSSFSYIVRARSGFELPGVPSGELEHVTHLYLGRIVIDFSITCNGFKL